MEDDLKFLFLILIEDDLKIFKLKTNDQKTRKNQQYDLTIKGCGTALSNLVVKHNSISQGQV